MKPFSARKTRVAPRSFPRAGLLTLFFPLGACGGYATNITWTAPSPRPLSPRSPESVEVFAGTMPARPHASIGIIEVQENSGSYAPRTRALLAELKRAAGEQGCDAISLGGLVNRGVGPDVIFNDFAADRQGAMAICLVYTDDPRTVSVDRMSQGTPAPGARP
jgi:hypothetical protein